MSQQKQRLFEAGFKLTVVQFAEQSSNRAAGRNSEDKEDFEGF